MKYHFDHYVLESTGRSFRVAHSSVLGIGEGATIMSGFDRPVEEDRSPVLDDDEHFTSEERKEIAEEMIRRWKKWAET